MSLLARAGNFVLFRYNPSIAAAIVFAALFLITTSLHVFQASRKRTFYFIPLILGGVFEVLGYIFRAIASKHQQSLGIYIIQVVLLLVAPALLAASIYMVLGRLMRFTESESLSPIRVNWLTKIFVCGDVFSFFVQSGGSYYFSSYFLALDRLRSIHERRAINPVLDVLGGSMESKASSLQLGKHLILIGLFLQIIFFGVFLVCGGIFHYRLVRKPTLASSQVNWTKFMYAMYGAGTLILIRSLFRVLEFTGGNDGPIMTHEYFLYVFDGVLMLGVMVIFNVVHPGQIIGRKSDPESMVLENRGASLEGLTYQRK